MLKSVNFNGLGKKPIYRKKSNGNSKKRLTAASNGQYKKSKIAPIKKDPMATNQFQNIFSFPDNDDQILKIINTAIAEDINVFKYKNDLTEPLKWEGDSEKNTFFHMLAQFGSEKVINNVINLALDSKNIWLRDALMFPNNDTGSSSGFTFFHLFLQRGNCETAIKIFHLACDPNHQWLRDELSRPISNNPDWNGYNCFHLAARFAKPTVIATILLLSYKSYNGWISNQLNGPKINFHELMDKFCSSNNKSEIIKLISEGHQISTNLKITTINQSFQIKKLEDEKNILIKCIELHKEKEEQLEFLREYRVTDASDCRGFADQKLQDINLKIEELNTFYQNN